MRPGVDESRLRQSRAAGGRGRELESWLTPTLSEVPRSARLVDQVFRRLPSPPRERAEGIHSPRWALQSPGVFYHGR